MQYLESVLQQAINVLDGDIRLLKIRLADAPQGELKSYKTTFRGKESYKRFLYSSDGRKYLKKADEKNLQQYAKNTFYKLKLADLESEKERLKSFMEREKLYAASAECYANSNSDIKSLLKECLDSWDEDVIAWANAPYKKSTEYPEHLQYETKKGDIVRSRAEMTIADILFNANIPYRYEPEIYIGGERIYPDFLIMNPITKEIYILEYLGLLKKDSYEIRNRDKLIKYIKNGYIPSQNLILISESDTIPFDASFVRDTLRHYFGTFL